MWPGIPDTYPKLPESDSGSFWYTRSRDYQTPTRHALLGSGRPQKTALIFQPSLAIGVGVQVTWYACCCLSLTWLSSTWRNLRPSRRDVWQSLNVHVHTAAGHSTATGYCLYSRSASGQQWLIQHTPAETSEYVKWKCWHSLQMFNDWLHQSIWYCWTLYTLYLNLYSWMYMLLIGFAPFCLPVVNTEVLKATKGYRNQPKATVLPTYHKDDDDDDDDDDDLSMELC